MADIQNFSQVQVLDANGDPVSGAKAYFYQPGTLTLVDVFADEALTILHPSPLVASAAGVFPQVWCDQLVKCNVTTSTGAAVPGYPMDPVFRSLGEQAAASTVEFSPTVDIVETNVQDAIEAVQANLAAAMLLGSINQTTQATLLANLDTTSTASGVYRFASSTTGTFPTGVVALDGGIIRIWRQNSANGIQMLMSPAKEVIWVRYLVSGVYGAWQFVASDGHDAATWQAGVSTVPAVLTPALLAAAVPYVQRFNKAYQSAETVFAAGTEYTFEHGLTVMPKLVRVVLKCTATEAGYAEGREVDITYIGGGSNRGISIHSNATNTKIVVGSAGIDILDSTGGSVGNNFIITPANWRMIVRAYG